MSFPTLILPTTKISTLYYSFYNTNYFLPVREKIRFEFVVKLQNQNL